MNHRQLFDAKAEQYAHVRPTYPPELFDYLASLCAEQKTAWDGACGNGQAAVTLARYFEHVEATDISAPQIAHARPHPQVTYSVQPSEKTNFAAEQFDLVCIAQALHWFDYDRFWPEVKRVLKPGGVFAAWGYSWFAIAEAIDAEIREKFLNILEPYWAWQNKLLWEQYRHVPFPFERLDTPPIEMKMAWNLEQLFGYLQSWSAFRLCVEAQGGAFIAEAYDAVKAAWGDPEQKRTVHMEFCLLVGRHE